MAETINGVSVQDRSPMLFYPTNGNEVNSSDGRTASVFRDNAAGWAWLYNPWTGKLRDPRDIASDVYGLAIVPPTGCGDDHKAFGCRAAILDLLHLVEKSTCRFSYETEAAAADTAIKRIRDYLNMGVMPKSGEERLLEIPALVGSVVFGIGTPERYVVDSAIRAYAHKKGSQELRRQKAEFAGEPK